MKKLFNEDDSWTQKAIDVSLELSVALEEIMIAYAVKGYSVRDLSCIAHSCVSDVECKIAMDRRFK